MLRLSTFKIHGQETFGEYRNGKVYPVPEYFRENFSSLNNVIENEAIKDLKNNLKKNNKGYSLHEVKLLPPINSGARIFCVGLNYPKKYLTNISIRSMREKNDMILFSKEKNSLVGSNCPIIVPSCSAKASLDYEGELGIIIGKSGKNIQQEDALNHIFAYTIINDGSIRDWQKQSLFAGKNFENTGSCGPCILVNEDKLDPNKFLLTTKLNGKVVQKEKVENMIFKCSEIIAYISTILTLNTGDIIATGSPEGSGISKEPKRFLRNNDFLEIEITNIGTLKNKILNLN